VIADNRLALNADWDYEMLKVELKELDDLEFDVNLLGFEDKEIDILLAEPTEGLTDEDEVPDLPDEPVTKLGDLWQLGNHRLLCGDSTSIDAVDTLMDGNKADMVFTDPPYNALKSWKKDEANSETRLNPNEWFANDNMEWEDYYEFIKTSLTNIKTNSLYVCCDFRIYPLLFNLLVEDEYEIKHCIVWYKNTWGLGKRYRFQHELIIYATKNNPKFVGDNSQSDVWNVAVDRTTEHKTPKPVELPLKAITNTIEVNKICVDLFLGSGSTLLACEKSARKCFGIELDPKYCDLIINRWQDFTGKEAVHLELNKTYNELNEHEND
jgi:DNA modification methylase